MALRFQLLNDMLGPLIIERADPIGINSLTQTVKRSELNDGVIYEIVLDVDFIKEGRDYVKRAFEQAGGVDAEVNVNIYEYEPNVRRWQLYFTGRINFQKRILYEDRISIALEQTGFERRVLNLLEKDVDLETLSSENGSALPATNVIPAMEYHSKAILKEYNAGVSDTTEFSQSDVIVHHFGPCEIGPCDRPRDATAYGQIDTSGVKLQELTETFIYPWGFSETERSENYRAKEAGIGDVNISLNLKMSIYATQTGSGNDVDVCGEGILGNRETKFWFEHQDKDGNIKTLTQFGTYLSTAGCGGNSIIGDYELFTYSDTDVVFDLGDKVFVYMTLRISGTYELSGGTFSDTDIHHEVRIQGVPAETFIQIKVKTTAPTSTAKTILLHEAVQKCCQFYTNQADCFRSDLLGRPEIVLPDGSSPYLQDGQAALIGLVNGSELRGRPKQIFANLQDLIEFLESCFCVGFGFETINGKQVLRLEKRAFFYRKDQKILSLGKVYNVSKEVSSKRYYNQIEIGYAGKLDIGQTNAIDEFNTTRKFSIPVVNTKSALKVSTKMRASGYQIEYQRRLVSSTADGKLDDSNFAVCVIRDGITFKTKKDEGYSLITNVYDAPTGYNYDISPGRNLQNWKEVLAASLIRSTRKTVTFSSGEVNYLMTSQKVGEASPIAENGTLDLTNVEPIWENEIYKFKSKFTRDQMKLIKANPYGYIEFEDRFGEVMEGFISNIEHEPNDKLATFELLKVYRP